MTIASRPLLILLAFTAVPPFSLGWVQPVRLLGTRSSVLKASVASPQQQQQQFDRRPIAQDPQLLQREGFSSSSSSYADAITWDWKSVAAAAFENSSSPILLFDGVCNFCNAGVNLCLDLDDHEVFRFASMQSRTGQALLLQAGKRHDDRSDIVLVASPTKAYIGSDAVLKVASKLAGLPALIRWTAQFSRKTMPHYVRNELYHFVANRRHLLGQNPDDGPTCRLDFDGTLQARFVQDPVDAWQEEDVSSAAM